MAPMTGLPSAASASRRTTGDGEQPPRAVWISGLLAAANAAALGLLSVAVLVLVGWVTAADSSASATEAVKTALQVWLVGHHTALAVPGGSFGLVPLGLTVLPAALLVAAGRRGARASAVTSLRGVGALTVVIASSYAVLAALLALLARSAAVQPLPVSAFLGAGALGLLAGGAGALGGAGAGSRLWVRVPPAARLVLTGAAGGSAVLLAGGSLLAAGSLAVHHQRVGVLVHSLDAGATGDLLVFLLCLVYVPTAAVWGTSFTVGPGFAVGSGTSVTVAGVHLGAVPAFPLLAALPDSGTPRWPVWLALLLPVAGGVLTGLLVDRGDRAAVGPLLDTRRRVLAAGLSTGLVTGLAIALACAVTSGPGGPGRLADVGPRPWLTGLAAAAEIALVCSLTLLARRRELVRVRRGDTVSP